MTYFRFVNFSIINKHTIHIFSIPCVVLEQVLFIVAFHLNMTIYFFFSLEIERRRDRTSSSTIVESCVSKRWVWRWPREKDGRMFTGNSFFCPTPLSHPSFSYRPLFCLLPSTFFLPWFQFSARRPVITSCIYDFCFSYNSRGLLRGGFWILLQFVNVFSRTFQSLLMKCFFCWSSCFLLLPIAKTIMLTAKKDKALENFFGFTLLNLL